MTVRPLARISIGAVVERHRASNPWIDFVWRPVRILPGHPEAKPWTVLSDENGVTTFYAGAAVIGLYPSETANYRYNLESARPSIWLKFRATGGEPPYDLAEATADPSEGESFTEAGDDLVEALPMPEPVRAVLEAFVAEHHVERTFYKRKRNRADPEALSRRAPIGQGRPVGQDRSDE